MEESVTLVSCLFNLARTKWHHSGFPPTYDRYISWSQNFLSLNSYMILYVDSHYYDHVVQTRKKYDPELQKTIIYKKEVTELECYHNNFFQIATLMSSPSFKRIKHADCADNLYPLYNVVQYNKSNFMRDAAQQNPFKTSHFMWMDMGSCRDSLQKYENAAYPANKELLCDKIVHFTHSDTFGIDDKQAYFLSQIRNIQGTAFIVPQELCWAFNYYVKTELHDTMHMGFIGSDEKTYDSIYLQNKDLYKLVICGWFKFYDVMMEEKPSLPKNHPVNSDKKLTVVVNHYQHDTSWTSRLIHDVAIYNKNNQHNHLYERNLPNVGFDTIVYLKFIVDNYDNLPDYVAFLQDDPFYHCSEVIKKINSFKFDSEFLPLCTSYIVGNHDLEMTENYARRVGLEIKGQLKMLASCQCIVSKNLILKRPKSFYELLITTIDHAVKSQENYCIENLWPSILSFNEQLQPTLNCRSQGGKP